MFLRHRVVDSNVIFKGEFVKLLLLTILSIALSTGVWATEATDLRFKGVQAASNGDFVLAEKYLNFVNN